MNIKNKKNNNSKKENTINNDTSNTNDTNSTNNKYNYTFDDIQTLADRIEKIHSKKDLKIIKSIIEKNNPDDEFTKNSNGYFIEFQNKTPQTFYELNKFINKLEKKRLQEIASDILKSSEQFTETEYDYSSSDKSDKIREFSSVEKINILNNKSNDCDKKNKKYRITNAETHLLNRVKKEKKMKQL